MELNAHTYALFDLAGSSISSANGVAYMTVGIAPITTNDDFTMITIDISNNTEQKLVKFDSIRGDVAAGVSIRQHGGGYFDSTSKITQIKFSLSADSINVDSEFLLIGRK